MGSAVSMAAEMMSRLDEKCFLPCLAMHGERVELMFVTVGVMVNKWVGFLVSACHLIIVMVKE